MCDKLQVDSARASGSEQADTKEKAYCIYPDITPKICEERAFALRSRDFKDPQIIVYTLKVRGAVKWIAKERKPEKVL